MLPPTRVAAPIDSRSMPPLAGHGDRARSAGRVPASHPWGGPSLNRALARRAVSVVAAATAAAPLALIATAAHATLPGTNGQITYSNSSGTYVANADGSSPRLLPGARNASFAPDGSRIAYVATNGTGIWSVRADGSQPVRVTENATDDEPVFSSAGSRVSYTQQGRLRFAASRGGWWNGEVNENPDPSKYT